MQGWHLGLPVPCPWLSWAQTRPCFVHGDVGTAGCDHCLHCACAGGQPHSRQRARGLQRMFLQHLAERGRRLPDGKIPRP